MLKNILYLKYFLPVKKTFFSGKKVILISLAYVVNAGKKKCSKKLKKIVKFFVKPDYFP